MASNKNMRYRVSAPDDFPDFGAIFMANRATMKECIRRSLFGLPSSQETFVRGVRAGMLLFLFEYEDRLLYGVFRATSNGGYNVVPGAFGSRFPAQIRVSKIWDCDPLCEDEFGYAIDENYYDRFKFRFGLSQHQVNNLLLLFETTRTEGSTVGSLSCERKYLNLNGIESGNKETQRLAFWRKLSPNSNSSDQAAKDEARGSFFSSRSGNGISSFESKSDPYEFVAQFDTTISKAEPEKHNDSSKETAVDLEDFIPLPSPEHSDTEMESFENNQKESVALEKYLPMKLVVCECSKEGKQSSLQVNNSLKLNVNFKGLYSDGQKNSSVFSRLKFGPKDIGQENCGSSGEYRLIQESRGDSQWRHDEKETTVFSRLSLAYKVTEGINDTVMLKSGIGQHEKGMEETNFSRRDGYDYSEMRSLAYEWKGQEKQEETRGSYLVHDIMDTLLHDHSEWRKINSRREAFQQEDVNHTGKKNVFSRLSWSSESFQQDNVATTRLDMRNDMVIKSGRTRKQNSSADRWPETGPYKMMRGNEVPNGTYEAEGNFVTNTHISKMLEKETEIEEGEVVNDSVNKYKLDQLPRRKLVRPLLNKSCEAKVKTHSQANCLSVQVSLGECTANKENSGSQSSTEGNEADIKVASPKREIQDNLDPLRCEGDRGEANRNFAHNDSNSGELLVCVVKPPLKTYKRRAKVV